MIARLSEPVKAGEQRLLVCPVSVRRQKAEATNANTLWILTSVSSVSGATVSSGLTILREACTQRPPTVSCVLCFAEIQPVAVPGCISGNLQ